MSIRAAVSRIGVVAIEISTVALAVGVVVLLVRRIRPAERLTVPIARAPAHHAPLTASPSVRQTEPAPEPAPAPLPSAPPTPQPSATPTAPAAPPPPAGPSGSISASEDRSEDAPRPARGRGTIGDLLERARLEDGGAA